MGFGHRVYKNYDPRAKIIKKATDDVFEVTGVNPLLDIAIELEKIALEDDYFVSRKLYPNVDFYSGLIYEALGLPVGDVPGDVRDRAHERLDRPVARAGARTRSRRSRGRARSTRASASATTCRRPARSAASAGVTAAHSVTRCRGRYRASYVLDATLPDGTRGPSSGRSAPEDKALLVAGRWRSCRAESRLARASSAAKPRLTLGRAALPDRGRRRSTTRARRGARRRARPLVGVAPLRARPPRTRCGRGGDRRRPTTLQGKGLGRTIGLRAGRRRAGARRSSASRRRMLADNVAAHRLFAAISMRLDTEHDGGVDELVAELPTPDRRRRARRCRGPQPRSAPDLAPRLLAVRGGHVLVKRVGSQVRARALRRARSAPSTRCGRGRDELERRGRGAPATTFLSREFEPVQQVGGRGELRGPHAAPVRGGIDVRGDGSTEA